MPKKFQFLPGRTRGWRDDGKLFFDTSAFPVGYAPESQVITLTGQTITFPDFRKGDAYGWQQWDSGDANNNPRESAISLITIGPQEWGPLLMSPPPTVELPETVIATVPANCDHIRVKVRLTRTVAPSQINGNTIPVAFEEGAWVNADGGSLPIEYLAPIARLLTFRISPIINLDGTRNVVMRRTMSTVKAFQNFYRGDNSPNSPGWTWGGPYGGGAGIPVAQRDTRGPTTDVTGIGGRYKRNGSSPAATSDNTNYQSVYTGDIVITAGRAGAAIEYGGADPNATFPQYLGFFHNLQANVATFNSWASPPQPSEEGASRHILVAVRGVNTGTTARTISSVLINGNAALQIAARSGNDGTRFGITAFYIVSLPTGMSPLTLSITFSAAMAGCTAEAWALYNLQSITPAATLSAQSINTLVPVPTPSGQSVFIGTGANATTYGNISSFGLNPDDFTIQMDNQKPQFDGAQWTWSRGFQIANGETLQIQQYNTSSRVPSAGTGFTAMLGVVMQ